MPCWYFDKADLKKTPSLQDGVPVETEARYRREGTRYIFDMGAKLGLSHDTLATAVVFFHRFYIFHSFKKFPRYITATCCLFLAGKVEETPKKCKDLVKVARSLLSDAHFTQFGDDPREEVMTFERILLQTIKFDLQVEHPYKYLLQYAKALKDKAKVENLVQMAWTFINDSFCTSLCLQWEPQIVAVAVMYLAGRLCKFEPQDWAYNRGRWWEQFIDDISMDLLEDICHQVLDLYSHQKPRSGSSKAKRERPKTPGDGEKSNEPQAKTSRQDSKHTKPSDAYHKTNVSSSSAKVQAPGQQLTKRQTSNQSSSSAGNAEVSRQDSTNTEVVAMDTVETSDSGTIETHPASHVLGSGSQLSVPSNEHSLEHAEYYGNVNQYQSFIASGDLATTMSVGLAQQHQQSARQYNYANNDAFPLQPPSGYGSLPTTPQTSTASRQRPSYTGAPPPPFQSSYSQSSFEHLTPGFPPRFPTAPVPPSFEQPPQNFYPGMRGPVNPSGLATVRITGRREQQGGNQWV